MARDMTMTERIALAAYILVQGKAVTARELASVLQTSPRNVRYMLDHFSRVMPLVVDDSEQSFVWRLMPEGSDDGEVGQA